MVKKFFLMSVFLIGLFSCGSNGKQENSTRVVVYSNSLTDGRGDYLKEEAKKAGFDLEFVSAGGGEIADRIISEKNNPIADVVFGPNEMEFLRLEEAEVLEAYEPKWKQELDSKFIVNKDNLYFPLVKQATLFVYNTEKYSESEAPKDIEDLWNNPKFHKKYEFNSILKSATMKKAIAGILSRYRDDNGEYGVSEKGWQEIKKFFDNGVKSVKGEDVFSHIANGKVDFGIIHQSGVASREEQFKIKVKSLKSITGVPVSTEQIALVKGSKNPEKAKEFIDWFGSSEVQLAWSNKFSSVPVNKVAFEKINPELIKIDNEIQKADLDWGYISKNVDKWVEKIELQILK